MEFKEDLELVVEEGISLDDLDKMKETLDKLPLTVMALWPSRDDIPPKITLRGSSDEMTLHTDPDNKVLYEGLERLPPEEYKISIQVQTSEYVAQGPYYDIIIEDKRGNIVELR